MNVYVAILFHVTCIDPVIFTLTVYCLFYKYDPSFLEIIMFGVSFHLSPVSYHPSPSSSRLMAIG